jgi:hypothetical protein
MYKSIDSPAVEYLKERLETNTNLKRKVNSRLDHFCCGLAALKQIKDLRIRHNLAYAFKADAIRRVDEMKIGEDIKNRVKCLISILIKNHFRDPFVTKCDTCKYYREGEFFPCVKNPSVPSAISCKHHPVLKNEYIYSEEKYENRKSSKKHTRT